MDANTPAPAANRHVSFPGHAHEGKEAPSLEGYVHLPLDGTQHPGIVLCHANPAAGGNMDMGVMLALEEALGRIGFATLRYNSRGVGESSGAVSTDQSKRLVAPEGRAETEDVGAALDFMAAQEGVDQSRLGLVGHSFGARISLAYLAAHPEDERVRAVACIGLPVAWRDLSHLGQWPHPKLFVTGDRDDFSPPDALKKYASGLPEPANVVVLRDAGHFFEGSEEDMAAVVAEFMRRML